MRPVAPAGSGAVRRRGTGAGGGQSGPCAHPERVTRAPPQCSANYCVPDVYRLSLCLTQEPTADSAARRTMTYAIVIDLDHDSHPEHVCAFLWNEIKEKMLASGFRCDGRMFVINLPPPEACQRARAAIDSIEDHLEYHRKHLYKYLREFYGFPLEARVNLLVPPIESIEVKEG
jgi:hypothetical protein